MKEGDVMDGEVMQGEKTAAFEKEWKPLHIGRAREIYYSELHS